GFGSDGCSARVPATGNWYSTDRSGESEDQRCGLSIHHRCGPRGVLSSIRIQTGERVWNQVRMGCSRRSFHVAGSQRSENAGCVWTGEVSARIFDCIVASAYESLSGRRDRTMQGLKKRLCSESNPVNLVN